MEEIKSCPFCGGDGVLREKFILGISNRKNYWIVCGKCQARIQDRRSIKRAVEAWNNRISTEENID